MASSRTLQLARIFAWAGLAALLTFGVAVGLAVTVGGPNAVVSVSPGMALNGYGAVIVLGSAAISLAATVGMALTILFGWRKDR